MAREVLPLSVDTLNSAIPTSMVESSDSGIWVKQQRGKWEEVTWDGAEGAVVSAEELVDQYGPIANKFVYHSEYVVDHQNMISEKRMHVDEYLDEDGVVREFRIDEGQTEEG